MQPLPPPPCRVKNGRIFHAFSRGLASRFVWMGIEGSLFIGSMHFVRAGILRKSKDAKKWDKEKTPWKFNIRYQKWWFGRFVFYQKWLFWISMLYKFTPPQKKKQLVHWESPVWCTGETNQPKPPSFGRLTTSTTPSGEAKLIPPIIEAGVSQKKKVGSKTSLEKLKRGIFRIHPIFFSVSLV